MAWTAPRTWVTGELVTSTMLNTHVRDNLNYLFGAPIMLGDQTLGSPSAGMAFTSIPATYRHLLLFVNARLSGTSTSADVSLRINSDSSASYDWKSNAGSGVAVGSWRIGDAVGATSDIQHNPILVFIPDYASTTMRKGFAGVCGGYTVAAGGAIAAASGGRYFANLNAITRLDVFSNSLSLDTATHITLYGI